jgi:hypothetical protein
MVEESIDQGTPWVMFEANDEGRRDQPEGQTET